MVLVVADFIYGKTAISVPRIIGPNTIKGPSLNGQATLAAPHGMVLQDTRVIGPHPYRGGRVGLTVILYKIKHDDHARALLGAFESIASTVGVSMGAEPFSRIGGAVVEGLESLLGLGEAEPVAGHRVEFGPGAARAVAESFSALFPQPLTEGNRLRVVGNRLHLAEPDAVSSIPYRASDYVLYSLVGSTLREDETTLPFHPLRDKVLSAAAAGDDTSWTRAKATLATLHQELMLSPDLTDQDAERLLLQYKAEAIAQRERARGIHLMPLNRRRAHKRTLTPPIMATGNRLDRMVELLSL
jgi:hypothetical protein